MEDLGRKSLVGLQDAVEDAQERVSETGQPHIVYRDPEVGGVYVALESVLPRALAWLNLTDVLWTSAAGMLPEDLLDGEYKRLAEVQGGYVA